VNGQTLPQATLYQGGLSVIDKRSGLTSAISPQSLTQALALGWSSAKLIQSLASACLRLQAVAEISDLF